MPNFMNLVKTGLGALDSVLTGSRRPLNVMFAVTNRCNAHCRYCDIPSRGGQDIPTAAALRLIDEIAAAGASRIGFWGGEPLMRDDIGLLVSRANRRGLYTTMDTNGALWNERKDELRDLNHVIIALDGRESRHDANRGAGAFKRAVSAIESASGVKGLKTWTITVLNRENIEDIDYILDLAERFRIRCTFQILHHNEIMGRNQEPLMPGNEEYRKAIRRLAERKKSGARVASSSRYLEYLAAWPDYRQSTAEQPRMGLRCKAGACYCNIDADGKVYACSLLIGKEKAENALEKGFLDAFKAIPPLPCQACTAGCFTEYNYLYRLDPVAIWQWLKAMKK